MPQRQIHLDFHTSPVVEGIGAQFDPKEFAETLRRAHVQSVTVFAKCHHGMCYYPTRVGTVHPHLGFDLLGRQIEALHRAGILAPIYVTVVWDNETARRHPEWQQFKADGSPYGPGPREAGWKWMSMAARGYGDELAAQTEELLALYGDEVDGFFYDIVMTGHEGDHNPEALARHAERGLPDTVAGYKQNDLEIARALMRRLTKVVHARRPGARGFYNSRFGLDFRGETDAYTVCEIEALPTGGWGYDFYPFWSRYGRRFDLPMLGMTGRFHKSWADFGGLKEPAAVKFDCGSIMANGGAISIGDQLHPCGKLDAAVYDVIGEAFGDASVKEPYCEGAEGVPEVGLIAGHDADSNYGAGRVLIEGHVQFDTLDEHDDLDGYRLVVVPECVPAGESLSRKLAAYLESGGMVLAAGEAAFGPALEPYEPAGMEGPAAITPTYFRSPALREFDYVFYEPILNLKPLGGATVLVERRDALFTRTREHFTSHAHAPAQLEPSPYAFAVRRGGFVRVAGPAFGAYYRNGTVALRKMLLALVRDMLGDTLVRTDAPATAEVTLMRQPVQDRFVAHVVNYSPLRRGSHIEVIEASVPLHRVGLSVRLPEGFDRARAVPGGALPVARDGDYVRVTVPLVREHTLVVFERGSSG